jgi:hypothetical protein
MQGLNDMALFVVSYDLMKEKSGYDYGPLGKELTRIGEVKTLLSVWYVDLDNTAQEVYDHIMTYLDDNDRLMVVEFSKKPAWGKALQGTRDWISAHFS